MENQTDFYRVAKKSADKFKDVEKHLDEYFRERNYDLSEDEIQMIKDNLRSCCAMGILEAVG